MLPAADSRDKDKLYPHLVVHLRISKGGHVGFIKKNINLANLIVDQEELLEQIQIFKKHYSTQPITS